MAYKIIWAPEAIHTLEKIVVYLSENWSNKEVSSFLDKVERTTKILEKNPFLFRGSISHNVHEALITKHNLLLYQIIEAENKVELLSFWDTRKNPTKKFKRSK